METITPETAAEFHAPIEALRAELLQKHADKLNHWKFLELPLSEEEKQDRQEIITLNPTKVKVLCNAGENRSAFVANILNQAGFEADNSGVTGSHPFTAGDFAQPYDALVFMTETVRDSFYSRAEELQMIDIVKNIPARILNFPETSVFYGEKVAKEATLTELKPKIQKALDRIGFVEK